MKLKILSLYPPLPRRSSSGFTLIELILSMAFFSFMMLLISVGVIQVMRIYQSNLATRRTQQAARLAVEDITREVRTASRVATATIDELCLEGNSTIKYLRRDYGNEAAVLHKQRLQGNCASATVVEETRLVGDLNPTGSQVQARQFDATILRDSSNNPSSVKFVIGITTGARDLITTVNGRYVCRPGAGSQFCSATSYSSSISVRGGSL